MDIHISHELINSSIRWSEICEFKFDVDLTDPFIRQEIIIQNKRTFHILFGPYEGVKIDFKIVEFQNID